VPIVNPHPTSIKALALIACLAAGVAHAGPSGGVAVAPLRAVDVPDGTASILTGLAEGITRQYVTEGRLVAHGELLRTVDGGAHAGCRSDECFARAARRLGAAHLLTGEVGVEDGDTELRVRLTAIAGDGAATEVLRTCDDCDAASLPAMLEEALLEALAPLAPPPLPTGDDGRTITLGRQRVAGEFRYEETHHAVTREQLELDGVQLSALTRPDAQLSCLAPGERLVVRTTLQAQNPFPEPRTVRGTLALEVLALDGEVPVVSARDEISLTLAGHAPEKAAPEPEGGFDDHGAWVSPPHVAKHSLEVEWTAEPSPGLRARVTWDGEVLEEIDTRPVTAVARLDEFYLTHEGERVGALSWGQPMEAHLVLTKLRGSAPAEVTLRMERVLRYWFDTENVQAVHTLAADTEGSYHLVLPFTPDADRRDSSRGYGFEVWVNGCAQYRSEIYE